MRDLATDVRAPTDHSGLGDRKLPHSFRAKSCDVAGEKTVAPPLCHDCGGNGHEFDRLSSAYVYLLGMYLGDGSIATHPRGVYRLRIFLDTRYPGIVSECEAAIQAVLPSNKVSRQLRPRNNWEISCYSKAWPCLFPQHGPGKKHLRSITLTDWQRDWIALIPGLLLRGLLHSDGCRFVNTGRSWAHPRYSFSNRSADIRHIFCDTCELLGLRWTASGSYTIYVSRKEDVAELDWLVGPKY